MDLQLSCRILPAHEAGQAVVVEVEAKRKNASLCCASAHCAVHRAEEAADPLLVPRRHSPGTEETAICYQLQFFSESVSPG